MRDVLTMPLNAEEALVIAADNSGGIGMKEHDLVHVPYETVAYYSFRVAVMECIAAGGKPFSVVLHNFSGNEAWARLIKGIQLGLAEIGMEDIPITGSTESNFSLLQSGIGLVVLGKKSNEIEAEMKFSDRLKFAVIGMPLVGEEVIEQKEGIVPLSVFQEVSRMKEVVSWPVGSHGILYEINQMFDDQTFSRDIMHSNVDVEKSSGPSTCFLAVYFEEQEPELRKRSGHYFHSIQIG